MSAADTSKPWSPVGAWFGQFEGTAGGKLLVEFAANEEGTLVLVTARSGNEVVNASGLLKTTTDGPPTATLDVRQDQEAASSNSITMTFLEMQPSRLRGRWGASTGDRGVFFVDPGEAQGQPGGGRFYAPT